MIVRVAHSGFSYPSAAKIASVVEDGRDDTIQLVRSSQIEVDVNWGRAFANARLNRDTSPTTNKRLMRQRFAEQGVPMPRLVASLGTGEAVHLVHEALTQGAVLLGRPDRHTKRRGMWLIRSEDEFVRSTVGTRKKKAATHFMEWIDADREYRVHVFQGRSIRISRKDYAEDKTWTSVKPGDIPLRTVRDAAKQAVAALGLDFGAVDVLAVGENNEQVYVLEVNAAPGLGGSMPRVYAETFLRWKEENDG